MRLRSLILVAAATLSAAVGLSSPASASVVDGLFAGSTVVQTKVLPATDLTACLTPQGLTSVSGTTSFTAVL